MRLFRPAAECLSPSRGEVCQGSINRRGLNVCATASTFARTLFRFALPALCALMFWHFSGSTVMAGEADLAIPDLSAAHFNIFGGTIPGDKLLLFGSFVIAGTLGISLYLRGQIKKLPAHKSMLSVADIIFKTCKTYLIQQGK